MILGNQEPGNKSLKTCKYIFAGGEFRIGAAGGIWQNCVAKNEDNWLDNDWVKPGDIILEIDVFKYSKESIQKVHI